MGGQFFRVGLLIVLGAVVLPAAEVAPGRERFVFAALGCMPYGGKYFPAFERLIAEVNRHQPAFTLHLGDTKKGDEPPSEALLGQVKTWFNTFDGPLIYTPGDNEWTDVHSASNGRQDPLDWLAKVRALYFAEERSLGRAPMALVTQRRDAGREKFVENARWTHHGVVFATVHVVGSNNGLRPRAPEAVAEFHERDAANAAWVRATFAEARATRAAGVALCFQAEPFARPEGALGPVSGFKLFLETVAAEARAFAKPVLLLHSDKHRYRYDPEIAFEDEASPVTNVTRVETFGENDVHAVLIVVDPASPQVFFPCPLLVPGNTLPAPPPAAKKR